MTKKELYEFKRKSQEHIDELEKELREWKLDAESFIEKVWLWLKTRKVPVLVGIVIGWNLCYFLGSVFGIG